MRQIDSDQRRFDQILDSVDAVVWEWDARRRRLDFVSRRVETMVGFPPERWQGDIEFWASRIHPDDRDTVTANFDRIAREGGQHRTEYRMIHADGRAISVADIIAAETDESGRQLISELRVRYVPQNLAIYLVAAIERHETV